MKHARACACRDGKPGAVPGRETGRSRSPRLALFLLRSDSVLPTARRSIYAQFLVWEKRHPARAARGPRVRGGSYRTWTPSPTEVVGHSPENWWNHRSLIRCSATSPTRAWRLGLRWAEARGDRWARGETPKDPRWALVPSDPGTAPSQPGGPFARRWTLLCSGYQSEVVWKDGQENIRGE